MPGDGRPRVTIAVPAGDASDALRATISSALAQTLDSLEVLVSGVAEDGRLAGAVATFDDPRVRFAPPEAVLDPLDNLARCLQLGDGTYVAVVAPGAVMEPENLERKVAVLDAESQVVVVHSAIRETDEAGAVVSNRREPSNADVREGGDVFLRRAFAGDHDVVFDTAVWRRSAIAAMEPLLVPRFDGWDAAALHVILAAAVHGSVAYLRDPLVSRPIGSEHADPVAAIVSERQIKESFLVEHQLDVAEPERLRALARRHATAGLTGVLRSSLASSDRREALEILRRSARVEPRVLVSRPVIRDTVKALSGPRGRRILRWGAQRSRQLLARG